MALFEAALSLDRKAGNASGQPRYRSYYGLCQALRGGKVREGLRLCRDAAREEFFNPEMWLNLGRVELAANRRRAAYRAFVRGANLAPENGELQEHLSRMGIRRRPALPFLRRSNPLNVWMGRLAARRAGPRAAAGATRVPSTSR
jgi:hypothetical protein